MGGDGVVSIQYCPRAGHLRVRGHAGAGEPGEDIVCAAVSILVMTLLENIRELEAEGLVTVRTLGMGPGSATLWCEAAQEHRQKLEAVFTTIGKGFQLLGNEAGQFVQCTEL